MGRKYPSEDPNIKWEKSARKDEPYVRRTFLRDSTGSKIEIPEDGLYDVEFMFGEEEEQTEEEEDGEIRAQWE